MRTVYLDCRACSGKETLHQALAHALSFPKWYGGNLDALHDCLTDLRTETRLVLVGMSALGGYGAKLTRCLQDAEKENPSLHLRLEG